jgi:hypothetical protein
MSFRAWKIDKKGNITGRSATIPKICLRSSPDEDGFSSSETKHDKTAQRRKLFASARRLQNLSSQTQEQF